MLDKCEPPLFIFRLTTSVLNGGVGAFASGLLDDCARVLPSADVTAAGVNDGRGDEGIEAASNIDDSSWVRDVPLEPLEKVLPRSLEEDWGTSTDLERSADEKGG